MELHIVGDRAANAAENTPEFTDEDLLRAENELREEAKQLVKRIDLTYWDLGRVLYDVYDGVPGGYRALMQGEGSRKDRLELFKKWGYDSFGDYCEKEVGLGKRTGENIRYAYYWFAIEQELDQDQVDKLMMLGRSKIYQLAGIAVRDDVDDWIKRAEGIRHDDLKQLVKTAKAIAASQNPESSDIPSEDGGDNKEEPASKKLPKPEELHMLSTSLYDEQWGIWNDAYERSKGISGSDKIGHNLTLICQDFLANNEFGTTKEEDRAGLLSKMESSLNVHLIAIDPSSGKPVHGGDLLWRLITEAKGSEEEAE